MSKRVIFISGRYENLDKLNEYLNNDINIKTGVEWFAGVKMLTVKQRDYLKALTYGAAFIENQGLIGISWMYNKKPVFMHSSEFRDIDRIAYEAIATINQGCLLSKEIVYKLAKESCIYKFEMNENANEEIVNE